MSNSDANHSRWSSEKFILQYNWDFPSRISEISKFLILWNFNEGNEFKKNLGCHFRSQNLIRCVGWAFSFPELNWEKISMINSLVFLRASLPIENNVRKLFMLYCFQIDLQISSNSSLLFFEISTLWL